MSTAMAISGAFGLVGAFFLLRDGSLIRCLLAGLRLGYCPKIGVKYEFASSGPFGETLVPIEVDRGYVKYIVEHKNGIVTEHSATFSTWAMMCVERAK